MTERLTTIAGSMFAGKSEELLRRVTRAEYAGRETQVFKPALDNRWGTTDVRSHSGSHHEALAINNPLEILENLSPDTKLVAIDEVQFFDENIISTVLELLDRDIEVVVAGLPTDFRGEPFGSMPTLLAIADQVERLTAICTHINGNNKPCGADATRTQRLVSGKPANYTDPIVMIGAEESYQARCPNHHIVPGKPKINR